MKDYDVLKQISILIEESVFENSILIKTYMNPLSILFYNKEVGMVDFLIWYFVEQNPVYIDMISLSIEFNSAYYI